MFSTQMIKALIDAANADGIKPASMLALAEVEGAASFEQDGRTPALLYERHIAWRQAGAISRFVQSAFAAAGLAIPKWSRATQYKDQGTSAKRLALIAKARGVHEEVANASASWGIGQTMGFLFKEMGFASACAMVEHMTGSSAGQVDCMVREIKNKHLIPHLNNLPASMPRLWRASITVRLCRKIRYDARIADAFKRWTRKLDGGACDRRAARPT
jgi:hypothetical protein